MLDKWLFLTWRKLLVIVAAWVLSVVLHNAVYALFHNYFGPGGDEPVFFIFAVIVIPLYFVGSLFYTVTRLVRKAKGE